MIVTALFFYLFAVIDSYRYAGLEKYWGWKYNVAGAATIAGITR